MGADRYGRALTAVDLSKAEFYGDKYISDSIVTSILAETREKQYQYYVTDALKAIVENTAKGGGITLNMRYCDWIEQPSEEEQPKHTPEEVKATVIDEFKRLRGEK